MSKTVDERVVSMQFDNKKFEQNVQTSINTLDKLKSKLNLKGAAKGLENVESAAKKVTFSGITKAAEAVSVKFSALQTIATTALATITHSAVNAGTQLVKSLSIDQITAGWQKYGEKTASVQTIMNATGKSIDEVNAYLDKLMWFSDETSYSFTDMTSALGQLTSAGGDIDKLVPLITGVANATAFAGKGVAEFSRAMYNLNQSYSAGYLQYMDWKSLEMAGIASKQLKQVFIDTAVAMGKIGEGEVTLSNFGETLKDRWADTSVMEAAFGKFGEMTEKAYAMVQSGEASSATEAYAILAKQYDGVAITAAKAAQEAKTFIEAIDATKDAVSSGWMKTFELIFGNYQEAKVLWTDLANTLWDIFASGSEARNELLKSWKDLGGRTAIIDSAKNAFEALFSVINPIKEAFREIFPKKTAEELYAITERIKEFTSKLILSEKAQAKLKSTFKGLFAVIDIGVTIIKEVIAGMAKLIGKIAGIGSEIIITTGSIGDWISKIRDGIKESGFFAKVIGTITNVLSFLISKIRVVIGFLSQNIIAPGFEGLLKLFTGIGKILGWIADKIVSVIKTIGQALSNAFRSGDMNTAMDLLNGGIVASILLTIKKFVGGFTKSISEISSIAKNITGILDAVKGCFEAYQHDLKANTLLKIAGAIAILAAALLIIASIDPTRLTASLAAIAALFGTLFASLSIFSKIGLPEKGIIKASASMILMSTAVLVLAAALKKISDISADGLLRGVIAIGALTTILILASKKLPTGKDAGRILDVSAGLILFGIAMNLVAAACSKLATIDTQGLIRGVVAIGAIMSELLVFMYAMPKDAPKMSTSIIALSTALLVMSIALKKIGSMSWEDVAKGLVALGASMIILAVGLNVMKGTLAGSAALILASVALGMLVPSMLILGKMSWENLAKGLMVMAVALAVLGVSAYALGPVLGVMAALAGIMALTGVSLLILGVGLSAVAAAFKITDAGTIAKGLMAIGGAMIVFAASIALPALLSPLIMLLGAALLILGKGLIAVGLAFAIMDFGTMAKGLMALGGAFTVFVLAALPAILLSPLLLIFAGAMLLLGKGVFKLALGLTALAAAFSASGVIIINAIKMIFTTIIGMIPSFIEAIGKGIILICKTIANSIGAITEAITAIITAIMGALEKSIPKIVSVVFKLLDALLTKLVKYTPKIVAAVFNILVACLKGISKGLPKVVKAAADIVESFLKGLGKQIPRVIQAGAELAVALVQGIADSSLYLINAGIDIIVNFLNGIGKALGRVVQAGWDLIINFIDGITASISANTPRLVSSIKALFKEVLNAAVTVLTAGVVDLEASGGNLIEGFKKGITSKLSKLWNKVKKGFNDFKNKVAEFFGIHSPSKVFAEFGQYLDEGLVVGLNKYSGKVSNSAENVGKDAIKSMSGAISAISSVVDSDMDNQPTIRPVLDLSDVESGANTISDLLGGKQSVGVLANVRSISNSMNSRQNIGASDIISAIKSLSSSIANGQGGVVYNVNGVTYDDGSNIADAISTLVRAAKIERRI